MLRVGFDTCLFIQCVWLLHEHPRAASLFAVAKLTAAHPAPGFTLEPNPADALMVACPLPPPTEWGDVLGARVALLRRRGLQPQLFLPAAALPPPAAAAHGGQMQHSAQGHGGLAA